MSAPARVLTFPVESPTARAEHSMTAAVEDVNAALWQARTVEELRVVEVLADAIRRLNESAIVAEAWRNRPDAR